MNISFNNTYAALPEDFYTRTSPTPVRSPKLFAFNQSLAEALSFKSISNETQENLAAYFSGNQLFEGSEPIAMAYSGHQFGGFSPRLGDGRAILLGEIQTEDKPRFDIQLKGSGRTPWSRGGDGRSALGPVVREYLLSEAMHKLGVPTTRALAAVTTGEQVARQTSTPGGIICRVSQGFVRVGTFQYFSSQQKDDALRTLADYEIERHYPQAAKTKAPYVTFLKEVMNAQAKLIAKWMSLGFIHGVMNTDNVSIVGETIDYGPCAFMDEFSHSRVYSSIDTQGRYAYQNQPQISQWNLIRLAETLLPLFAEYALPEQGKKEEVAVMMAQEVLNEYEAKYKEYWLSEMRLKLGLSSQINDLSTEQVDANDNMLISRLLDIMQNAKADFTLTFYYLSHGESHFKDLQELFSQNKVEPINVELTQWYKSYEKRLEQESTSKEERLLKMQAVNPVYIPRNHQVEAAIRSAEDHNDFSKFEELHTVLESPFERKSGMDDYMQPPKSDEVVHQTFCGT